MDILEEEGVADKTLIVLVGDHGLSIAEDLSFTPYHNPMIGNFHVPLVVSHPALPAIDIVDPVTSLQILPTLLDLLIETDTFPKCKAAAARDMLRNYEGQSLLRPQKTASDDSEYLGWQFTIMNPGASSLAVRNANEPDMRLIVPLQSGSEWRFTDLQDDPHEKEPLLSFDYQDLMSRLKDQIQRAWVERAVQVTEWWIKENRKRYRFRQ
jgi:arylsulfatase A-like enzyme